MIKKVYLRCPTGGGESMETDECRAYLKCERYGREFYKVKEELRENNPQDWVDTYL